MKPEHLTTHALGETLPPAEREALEHTLANNPQARADFDATRDFAAFLHQHLAADQPEAALTEAQKQRLRAAASNDLPGQDGTNLDLARQPSDRAARPTPLRWLQRAILPLSAAALVMIGLRQWQEENWKQASELAPASAEPQEQNATIWASPPGAMQRYSTEEGKESYKPLAVDTAKVAELAGNTHPDLYDASQKQAKLLEGEAVGKMELPPLPLGDASVISPGTLGKEAALPGSPSQVGRKPVTQVGLIASNNVSEAVTISSVTESYTGAIISQAPAYASKPQGPVGLAKVGAGQLDLAESDSDKGGVVVFTGSTVPSVSIDGLVATKDHTRARMLNEVNVAWEESVPVTAVAAPAAPATGRPLLSRSELKASEAARADGDRDSIDLQLSYSNSPSSPSSPPLSTPPANADSLLGDVVMSGSLIQTSDTVIRRELPTSPANESYTPIQENPLTAVVREPLSTFSIDVDTAAYANVRRFLNRNSLPPRDAVRVEELVNYFPYNLEGPLPSSPHPFAVHVEVADCPWQPRYRLARIGIQGKQIGLEQRNSNFVFLIDVSGSMNQPDKLPLVKESLRLLVEQLDEKDRVTLVTYAGSSGLVLPPTGGDQKQRILAAIDSMTPGGSTHGSAGIQLAYEQAIAAFIPDGVNRVLLCTDGDFNVGVSSPQQLETLITEKARSGVFLSVLGYGTGNLKDRTMETLADKGNGNYGYIDSLSEARKLLVEQMSGTLITIAKDVKIQVEFNPSQVASYRLIGYENRLLAKEDFNDDTKDAGEIGAGHSVTALYEVVPVGVTPPPGPVDPLKYQTPPAVAAPAAQAAAASPELLTVKLRYKAPDGDTSQLIEVPVTDQGTTLAAASPEFKFTTAVAAYGLMLRQSSYRGSLTWEQIRSLALEGKGNDPHGYRAEFLQLLDKARGLMPDQH